ncbi:Tricarboxylate transport membrane protein TctA [hydrothermal vent metagenome]|uniref:Tricarboxylate transport membrane protein TctA n=1 Tax=hydrothermal vent metagenome TaxID=652676 RepID=A0A3B1A1Q6_9ZZZZ
MIQCHIFSESVLVKMADPENKIITYLLLTALMVLTFASAILINNTVYDSLGWVILLVLNLCILGYLLRKG